MSAAEATKMDSCFCGDGESLVFHMFVFVFSERRVLVGAAADVDVYIHEA